MATSPTGKTEALTLSRTNVQRGVRLVLLSTANLAAAGTTYLVFAAVARAGSVDLLGRFAVATALATLVAQVVDAGTTPVSVRAAVQSDAPAHVLRTLVARRLGLAALAGVVAGVLLTALGWSAADAAATCLLVLASAAYGAMLMAVQGLSRSKDLVAIQWVNALLYGTLSVALVAGGDVSSIAVPLVAMSAILLAVSVAVLSLDHVLVGPRSKVRVMDRWVASAALANAITNTADTLLLGRFSTRLAAEYAANQRAAFGLSAVSSALTALLLPAAARDPERGAAWHRHLLIPLLAMPVLAGVMCFPVSWVASELYGRNDLTSPALIWCLLTAYGLGVLSVPLTVTMVAAHQMRRLATVGITQAGVVVIGALVSAVMGSVVLTGVSVLAGRAMFAGLVYGHVRSGKV